MATFRHLDMRALALQLALALGFGVAYRVNDTNHIKFAKTSEGFEMCGRACELSVMSFLASGKQARSDTL